ncbi:hypothetical protein EV426DRAFT_172375 [Tirmania nivea]|nr:hypothetical protein EV426DRAFT_172375 [Tirmania nivea]
MDRNDIKAIENARQRYSQLTHTLNSFQHTLMLSEQLPPWPSQQSQFAVLSSNLESISKTLSQHFPTVPPPSQQGNAAPYRPPTAPSSSQPNLQQDTLIAYPNPLFPSRDNETLIGMLFRKKPQPYVAEWMDAGRAAAKTGSTAAKTTPATPATPWLSDSDTYTLWNSASDILRKLNEERDWDDAYTMEERSEGIENVDVGLRPEMMEIGTLDEKGKRKLTVGGAPAAGPGAEGGLKLEQFFRFWSTGMIPHVLGQVPGQMQGMGR